MLSVNVQVNVLSFVCCVMRASGVECNGRRVTNHLHTLCLKVCIVAVTK